MLPVEFPDTVTVAVAHLGDVLDVPVHSEIPNPRPTQFVVVRRLGGPRRNIVADGAQLWIEAWGADDQSAHDLAQAARTALFAMSGEVIDGVQVYRVDEFAGPQSNPDPDSGQDRYTFQQSVMVRGTTLAAGS